MLFEAQNDSAGAVRAGEPWGALLLKSNGVMQEQIACAKPLKSTGQWGSDGGVGMGNSCSFPGTAVDLRKKHPDSAAIALLCLQSHPNPLSCFGWYRILGQPQPADHQQFGVNQDLGGAKSRGTAPSWPWV